jgi:hypothetical protein
LTFDIDYSPIFNVFANPFFDEDVLLEIEDIGSTHPFEFPCPHPGLKMGTCFGI